MKIASIWKIGVPAAIALGIAWQAYPLPDGSGRLSAMALSGPGFAGENVALDPGERAVYGSARVLKRKYASKAGAVLVTIVDGARNRHGVHDPIYCLRGAGWEVVDMQDVAAPHGRGEWLRATRGGQQSELTFWFSEPGSDYASPTRYWMRTALRHVTLGKSGSEPLLVIVEPLGAESVDMTQLYRTLPPLRQF